ncbi:hypothetical protein NA78x_002818 [Anatilimnocola sp. NA78]|uniref:hypothetical protein n=1 Tax=Anatilimnocola sp. NA78 TaxID=3415683 RepID=UPI003CE4F760
MSGKYPKRDSYFAHRFVRVLQKSCAAQDIGRDACLLLSFIAHTEDAARYTGPVRYWNSQLEQTMGFTSPKQLNHARHKAVEAGWLNYERAGTRNVGLYFVLIPERFQTLSDSPIEERGLSSRGDNPVTNHVADSFPMGKESAVILSARGMNSGTNHGKNSGMNSGKLSYPSPNPNPNTLAKSSPNELGFVFDDVSPPAPPAPSEPPVPAEKEPRAEDVPLPDELNVPHFVAARDAWLKQRRRKRLSLREEFLTKTYARLLPLGPAKAAECLRLTVDNDYSGVFPERFTHEQAGRNHRQLRVGPGQRFTG